MPPGSEGEAEGGNVKAPSTRVVRRAVGGRGAERGRAGGVSADRKKREDERAEGFPASAPLSDILFSESGTRLPTSPGRRKDVRAESKPTSFLFKDLYS